MEKHELRILSGILTFSFLLGIILGVLLSLRGNAEANREIMSFLSPIREGAQFKKDTATSLFAMFVYPLSCFLLGFSLPGAVAIPLVFTGRAFLLSYAVGACVRAFGAETGLLIALSVFALPLLLSLPCLFITGTQGMGASLRLCASALGRESRFAARCLSKRYFLRTALCLPVLCLSAAAELHLCPLLLRLIVPL